MRGAGRKSRPAAAAEREALLLPLTQRSTAAVLQVCADRLGELGDSAIKVGGAGPAPG